MEAFETKKKKSNISRAELVARRRFRDEESKHVLLAAEWKFTQGLLVDSFVSSFVRSFQL